MTALFSLPWSRRVAKPLLLLPSSNQRPCSPGDASSQTVLDLPSQTFRWSSPYTSAQARELILRLKNENRLRGVGKIHGELGKLGIDLSESTIRRILADFRHQGRLRASMSWRGFLRAHIKTLFAMDFLTVDTIFGQRFYVLVLIALKTRRIVDVAVTRYPNTMFLKQRLIELREQINGPLHLIHDNDPVFRFFPYRAYGIEGVCTAIRAPNMSAHVERFIGSLRREALDWFVIYGERQLKRILEQCITYYNTKRPHAPDHWWLSPCSLGSIIIASAPPRR